ncbi:arylamine N-acetyltransferase [Reichenbachiella agarivorans]|uniref:Arylamine N-acetyltransferase n=1 Tax=Reichenbachiella agarivorans TaxID=2979464 RepID=A0ABY6CSZ8_9BACT|nr:arylamine N-acetyltransferase [Reichenbachiella agarivorans]UXP33647.1 arylamine N-acetyltransferase [Reichenbachiella agarivorans]
MLDTTQKRQKPKLTDQQINQYLARIKTPRENQLSSRYLKLLHRNHLLHIPFENLDIHMHREIILDIDRIFYKVLIQRRGGFCFELNGLFYSLLQSLGFDTHLIGASVYDASGGVGPALSHAAILTSVNQSTYLCDVGFGDAFLTPKLLYPGEIQMDYNRYYRMDKNLDGQYILSKSEDSLRYQPIYLFSKQAYQLIEFIDMCHYHQTSSKSHFTQNKIITQAKMDGRITLTDKKFIINKLGVHQEQNILNPDEFCALLRQHFGIEYLEK